MTFIEETLNDEEKCKDFIRTGLSFFWNIGVDCQQDREDLTMEALKRMFASGENFRGNSPGQLFAFFRTICKNVFFQHLREKYRKNHESLEIDTTAPPDNNPHNSFMIEKLFDGINQLQYPSKAAIKLWLRKNSNKETAKILGLTVANTKVIISRDKKELKKKLNPGGENGYR